MLSTFIKKPPKGYITCENLKDLEYQQNCSVKHIFLLSDQFLSMLVLFGVLRHRKICEKLFTAIKKENHKLHHLLPPKQYSRYNLRNKFAYPLPKCRTKRYKDSFVFLIYNDLQLLSISNILFFLLVSKATSF